MLFQSCFKTFFICTIHVSKVTFIHFLCKWWTACCVYRKTAHTDVKILDSSVFKNRINQILVFTHPYFILN